MSSNNSIGQNHCVSVVHIDRKKSLLEPHGQIMSKHSEASGLYFHIEHCFGETQML